MAFISKLLASRHSKSSDASSNYKCQNYNFVCHELFTFAVEQVQVAVFRECDFRGRKLLFDSKSVERVSLDCNHAPTVQCHKCANAKTPRKHVCEHPGDYVETSNGFGYMLKKPDSDISHLAEMIFGSVAMTFRGSLYKIHNLDQPPRLVISQVFPSPRLRNSTPHQSSAPTKLLDHSLRLDDSTGSGSSQTSYSDQSNSDHLSTASDTLFICRRRQHSVPLDVPLNSSLISSSGYGGELSTSSLSSGPQSMPMEDCCTLSNSFSDNSTHRSLPTSMCLGDDMRAFRHRRASKLGLAIILQMTADQEKGLEQFIMDHIAVIETLLKRVRQAVEIAYVHYHTFVSAMFEASSTAAQWFVDLLTVAGTNVNMWQKLSNCDIPTSIKCDMKHLFAENCIYPNYSESRGLLTLTKRILKIDNFNISKNWSSDQMEKFVKDLCELIEKFDVKHTNFFLSTLMTGILTHHLGWVATLLPSDEIKCRRSPNLMIRQLCDLYGCIGYPSKIAHTIIVSKNDEELINKFINVLTYFIRCGDIKKVKFEREGLDAEHCEADRACNMDNNIPRQLELEAQVNCNRNCNVEKVRSRRSCHNLVTNNDQESFQMQDLPAIATPHGGLNPMGIKKRRTYLRDLSNLEESKELESTTSSNGSHLRGDGKVLFVLGADERLEKIKFEKVDENDEPFVDADFVPNDSVEIKPSVSCSNLAFEGVKPKRAQSEEPVPQSTTTLGSGSKDSKTAKYRYSGVKFNFQQYPQIFENYMKSKNIELNDMHLQHKKDFMYDPEQHSGIDFSKYGGDDDSDDDEPLQTPSNATELEYTSDLVLPTPSKASAKEVVENDRKSNEFVRRSLSNTLVMPETQITPLKTIELPMPRYNSDNSSQVPLQYTTTLIRSCSHNYIPNMALQGLSNPSKDWQSILKRDLILSAKHPISGELVEESVAVVGNVDAWTVSVISSHTYVIDKGIGGVPIGMSQLVANMLETLLKMWKLHTPPEYCLMHIEQKLREFCIQSKALAQMLLDTEYCSIDLLTSALKLEVNDVPLLMAVASIHTPEVTQKYGLRFQ